jgi:hypothetical protein
MRAASLFCLAQIARGAVELLALVIFISAIALWAVILGG